MAILLSQQRDNLDLWLAESGELYVCVYPVRGGHSGETYFCRTVMDIEDLMSAENRPEVVVQIFRRIQYPLRGLANESLLALALNEIPDGEWYKLVLLGEYYPRQCHWRGGGNSHAEMREDFSNVIGLRVGIGRDPFDHLYDARCGDGSGC